ncbi:MAG: fumarylacetoacetate hydrolase family protein, partial [Rhodococcus sp. (in: high G+C Gram-positive bacteria)]
VNGELWSTTSTAGMRSSMGESLAFASHGERIYPGELLTSGTLPRGCGLELDRWIAPGDRVELDIERIGSVTNTIGAR